MTKVTGSSGRDIFDGGAGDHLLTGARRCVTFRNSAGTAVMTDFRRGGDTLNVGLHGRAKALLADIRADAKSIVFDSNNDDCVEPIANRHNVDGSLDPGIKGLEISNIGESNAVTFMGLRQNDRLSGGNRDDALDGGSDTYRISDLGSGADVSRVQAGATAIGSIAGNWTAKADSSNDGIARLDIWGFALNLTAAKAANGWVVNIWNSAAEVSLTGSVKDELLASRSGRDVLDGGTGNDYVFIMPGDNDFVFNAQGCGHEWIADFQPGRDVLDVRGSDLKFTDVAQAFGKGTTTLEYHGSTIAVGLVG